MTNNMKYYINEQNHKLIDNTTIKDEKEDGMKNQNNKLEQIIKNRIEHLKDTIGKKELDYKSLVIELNETVALRSIPAKKIKGIIKTIDRLKEKIKLLEDILIESER